MTHLLGYAPPADRSRWPHRLRTALRGCGPGAVAVAAAGTFATAAVHWLRARTGQVTFLGLPQAGLYHVWIFVLPAALLTGLLLAGAARAVWRSGRGDRLPVALLAAGPVVALWLAGMYWLLRIEDRVFP